jgi:hypothetical protein
MSLRGREDVQLIERDKLDLESGVAPLWVAIKRACAPTF